ncbi:mariner Mos1 transposase [Trichonephila clavipes]|nr:mariner Mos1 transposase [Trichonephila clavipes]
MSNFMPSDHDLRTALILLPSEEKCYQIRSNACRSIRWQCSEPCTVLQVFEKFQNGDFDVRNGERGRPSKKFENAELQALLDEDDGKTCKNILQNNLMLTRTCRLKAMGMIIKVDRWVDTRANGPSTGKSKNRVRNVACPPHVL